MSDHQHRVIVSVEDGVKPAEDYAPARKVKVELTSDCFNHDELAGRAEVLGQLASQQVATLLGRTVATAAETPAQTTTRTRRTKEQIAADKAAEEAAAKAAAAGAATGGDVSMDDITLPPGSSDGASAGSDTSSTGDDISFDLDVTEPVKEITDVDLNNAVQAKNKEINNPGKIKELIATYRTDPAKPFNLTSIAQTQRQEFLDKLAALTVS